MFDQLLFDALNVLKEKAAEQKGGKGEWRKPGEGINEARDRLRAERQAAKERLSSYE